jgi:predicted transcriptional regulator
LGAADPWPVNNRVTLKCRCVETIGVWSATALVTTDHSVKEVYHNVILLQHPLTECPHIQGRSAISMSDMSKALHSAFILATVCWIALSLLISSTSVSQDKIIQCESEMNLRSNSIKTEASIISGSSDYIFPDRSLIDIADAYELSQNLSNKMGLTGTPTRLWNGSILGIDTTIHRTYGNMIDSLDSASWTTQQVSFNFTDGLITLYYDDINDANNTFLSFRSILFDSQYKAFNSSERTSVARSIVESLGIPYSNQFAISESVIPDIQAVALPYEDYQFYEHLLPSNLRNVNCTRTDLIMSSRIGDLNVSGSNIIGFSFNNDTGQLIRVEGSLFLKLPQNFQITPEQAYTIGRNAIPNKFQVKNLTINGEFYIDQDAIIGLRLCPKSDNANGSRTLVLGYEYAAYLSINNLSSSWLLVLIIDTDSGSIVSSWVFYAGIPDTDHGFITNGWLAIGILIPVSVSLIVVGVLIGPPELAFGILWIMIIPLYMRIKGSNVLDNFNRGRIYGYISMKPGCSFTELKKELAIINGGLAYHLIVLEKLGLIKSVRDINSKRFFISDVPARIKISQRLNTTGNLLIAKIKERENLSTINLARELKISRQRAHYNLRRLEKFGIVEHSKLGWHAKLDDLTELIEIDLKNQSK